MTSTLTFRGPWPIWRHDQHLNLQRSLTHMTTWPAPWPSEVPDPYDDMTSTLTFRGPWPIWRHDQHRTFRGPWPIWRHDQHLNLQRSLTHMTTWPAPYLQRSLSHMTTWPAPYLFTTGDRNIHTLRPLESRENFINMTNYAFASRWFRGKTFVKHILIY